MRAALMREKKGKFFIGTPMAAASKSRHSSKVTGEEELIIERQKRAKLEAELAHIRDEKPLNYYEVLPGVRIKRWFVVVLLSQALIWGFGYYWTAVLNHEMPEDLAAVLILVGSPLAPALWMTWMHKITGISYFDD
jgi:hypothetical protein